MLGFCEVDENPLGPLHEYEVAVTVVVRLMLFVIQTGLLLDAAGIAGMGFTVTVAMIGDPPQAFAEEVIV
jgi:hypothetical protein